MPEFAKAKRSLIMVMFRTIGVGHSWVCVWRRYNLGAGRDHARHEEANENACKKRSELLELHCERLERILGCVATWIELLFFSLSDSRAFYTF